MGFSHLRTTGSHAIYRHPCGVTSGLSMGSSDPRALKNKMMETRRHLRERGIDPDAVPAKPEPEEAISEPLPVLIDTSPLPVVFVPERKTTLATPPARGDTGYPVWCIQFRCYGRWVCMDQQRAPTPERALQACHPEVREWFVKANKTDMARIEPKEPSAAI